MTITTKGDIEKIAIEAVKIARKATNDTPQDSVVITGIASAIIASAFHGFSAAVNRALLED